MIPVITAFATSPDRGRGLARDLRVRWALEEVGQPYEVRLVSIAEMKEAPHLARHPFGQIPTFEEGGLTLFESGAIVHHIATTRPGLLPEDPSLRARALSWMFAAVNTIEPPFLERESMRFWDRDKPWHDDRLPMVVARLEARLAQLSERLGSADWLEGDFTAGDLMMAGVLFRIRPSGHLEGFANLSAYVARAEARPAFQRAFAAQRAVFEAAQGKGG